MVAPLPRFATGRNRQPGGFERGESHLSQNLRHRTEQFENRSSTASHAGHESKAQYMGGDMYVVSIVVVG